MTTIKTALALATQRLEESPSARLDSELLLAYILQKERTYLYAYEANLLTQEQNARFDQLIAARFQGHPIAYLVGQREFWSLSFKVTEATLIPRPETELLVEQALILLADKPHAKVLDMGTGSGVVALSCGHEQPNWEIDACDCSIAALTVAEENAKQLGINNVRFYQSEWFDRLDKSRQFDAILSNPPYIALNDEHLTKGDLRFEPRLALASGKDGLDAIQILVEAGQSWLKPGGWLCMEHGYEQKEIVQSMLRKYNYKQIDSWYDGQGHARVTAGRRME